MSSWRIAFTALVVLNMAIIAILVTVRRLRRRAPRDRRRLQWWSLMFTFLFVCAFSGYWLQRGSAWVLALWVVSLAGQAWQLLREPPQKESLQNFAIDPLHCGQCGYDLTGNVTGICSECGWKIPTWSEANNNST